MSERRRDRPPTSRLGRIARLATLAPRGLPLALEGARRALGAPDDPRHRERLLEEAKKTADAMLRTLGDMKGLPLKLGQMASYIDGLAPPGYEERFQQGLKRLLDRAPPLSPEAARRTVIEELGAPPEELFASFEREPFAAASLGQVHRAVTRDGRRVAVKVQYPGIDTAVENDLKSIGLLEAMAAPIGRRYQSREALEEVRAVLLGELDYEREAAWADRFRRVHAGDPEIVIPEVDRTTSSRRVLTCEYLEGRGYQAFCGEASDAERSAAGVAIWRFMFRALLCHGLLYADPHPGNYVFLPDGRVGFLDFGCAKQLPAAVIHGMKRYMRAAMDEDWEEFDRTCVEFLGYDPTDRASWELYRSYTLELLRPITTHEPFRCSPEGARETVAYLVRNSRKILFREGETLPSLPTPVRPPPEFTFVNRLQWGLASVLGGLRTEACFRPLIEPWVRGPLLPTPAP